LREYANKSLYALLSPCLITSMQIVSHVLPELIRVASIPSYILFEGLDHKHDDDRFDELSCRNALHNTRRHAITTCIKTSLYIALSTETHGYSKPGALGAFLPLAILSRRVLGMVSLLGDFTNDKKLSFKDKTFYELYITLIIRF